jgi:hypothetical protein
MRPNPRRLIACHIVDHDVAALAGLGSPIGRSSAGEEGRHHRDGRPPIDPSSWRAFDPGRLIDD